MLNTSSSDSYKFDCDDAIWVALGWIILLTIANIILFVYQYCECRKKNKKDLEGSNDSNLHLRHILTILHEKLPSNNRVELDNLHSTEVATINEIPENPGTSQSNTTSAEIHEYATLEEVDAEQSETVDKFATLRVIADRCATLAANRDVESSV